MRMQVALRSTRRPTVVPFPFLALLVLVSGLHADCLGVEPIRGSNSDGVSMPTQGRLEKLEARLWELDLEKEATNLSYASLFEPGPLGNATRSTIGLRLPEAIVEGVVEHFAHPDIASDFEGCSWFASESDGTDFFWFSFKRSSLGSVLCKMDLVHSFAARDAWWTDSFELFEFYGPLGAGLMGTTHWIWDARMDEAADVFFFRQRDGSLHVVVVDSLGERLLIGDPD